MQILNACMQVLRRPYWGGSWEARDGQTMGESVTTAKSFKIWVKPAVRWVFAAAAAGILAWTMLAHMAKQRAQREQEASHARYTLTTVISSASFAQVCVILS